MFYSLNFTGGLIIINYVVIPRGISSAGRALRWQRRGQRFDPAMLHTQNPYWCKGFSYFQHFYFRVGTILGPFD